MRLKENNNQYNTLSKEFVVGSEDLNHKGELGICKILNEIAYLNDLAQVLTFGDLNHYRIVASWHHIDFLGHAYKGEKVELLSEALLTNGTSLEVRLFLQKKVKRKMVTLVQGHFIFTVQGIPQQLKFG